MRRYGIPVALAVTLALTACGEPAEDPNVAPSPLPTLAPTPTVPPVAEDAKLVKQALVTPADLGKPWLKPKKVNRSAVGKGRLCPGQPNAVSLHEPRAKAEVSLTEGAKQGAAIGSYRVRTYAFGEEEKWRAAYAEAAAGCASWQPPEKTFVTLEVVAAPPAVAGADEVLAHIERVYADKTKKQLYYVRHYYEARTGRVVSSFEYAYVQPASDPTGKDMTKSAALLAKQVVKTRTTFGL